MNSISFTDEKVASASKDRTIQVWSLESKQQLYTVQHLEFAWNVAFGSKGTPLENRLITSSIDTTIRIWEAETGELQQVLHCPSHVGFFDFNHDSTILAAGSFQSLTLWSMESFELIHQINLGKIYID